jgi:hypothetical protein
MGLLSPTGNSAKEIEALGDHLPTTSEYLGYWSPSVDLLPVLAHPQRSLGKRFVNYGRGEVNLNVHFWIEHERSVGTRGGSMLSQLVETWVSLELGCWIAIHGEVVVQLVDEAYLH